MVTYSEIEARARAGEPVTDVEALDALADLFRLPGWNIGGSAAEFIDCVHVVVRAVRDTGGEPSPDLLAEADPT